MSNSNHIPEHDEDLKLAKKFGEYLEMEHDFQAENSLLNILNEAKSYFLIQEQSISVQDKSASLDQIWTEIGSDNQSSVKILSLGSTKKWVWAAAAAMLIMLSSIFILRQSLEPSQILIAEAGQSVTTIELTDGSSVTLRPHSQLLEQSVSENRHLYTLSGEAVFDVVTIPDRQFTVEAGNGRVTVLGTRFNIRSRSQQTSVHLFNGEVLFSVLDSNQSVTLQPGNAATISQRELTEPYFFEEELITGWIQNRLTFRNRDTASIIDELEFHFDIRINLPASLQDEKLGGSITLEDERQSLRDLGLVLGGEFVQTGDDEYQFRTQ